MSDHPGVRAPTMPEERGAALVVVALVAIVLMVLVALVVDLGNGRQERRHAQNAVDAAALAAAQDYGSPGDVAQQEEAKTAGREYLRANEFAVSDVALATDGDTYPCVAPDACTIEFSFRNVGAIACVGVRIRDFEVGTYFAGVIGQDVLLVGARATGCRDGGTPGGVVPPFFAGGECSSSGKAFVYSGTNNVHEGNVHSNYDVKLNGSDNKFIGERTYVEDPLDDPGGLWDENEWGPEAVKLGGPRPWPPATDDITIANLGPTSQFATDLGVTTNPATAGSYFYDRSGSDIPLSGPVTAGVYFTDKKITFGDSVVIVAKEGRTGATFISSGSLIELSGSNGTFEAFDGAPHELAFFTAWDESSGDLNNCDSETFKMNGSCNHIDGLVYAPRGKIRWSGDGNGQDFAPGASCGGQVNHPDFIGAFVSWAFEFSGNYNLTRAGIADEVPQEPRIYLDQ